MRIRNQRVWRALAALLAGSLMMAATCDINNPPPNTATYLGIAIAK